MSGNERVSDLSDYKLKKLWESSEPERSKGAFDVWKARRHQAQSDLFWLCQLLGYAVSEKAHRDIIESFFLKKNPEIPLDDLSGEKQDRLLFAPRDSYKSSIANADDVQWVICYPNVKLAVQSSKIDRAAGFVDEIKNFFLSVEDGDGNLTLTRFQVLFPEHVLPERSRGASGSFTTPARTRYSKEPTVQALSIEESKASGHYNKGRNDDVISESNSGFDSTPEARTIVGKKLIESRNLFDTILYIGTPQWDDDGYAMLQENLGDTLTVVVKAAWEVKNASATKPEADLNEADYDLLFPYDARGKAKLTYKVLRSSQRANPDSFKTQQLCQTTKQKRVHITEGMVRAHILSAGYESFERTPVISTWDLGYALDNRDFSVGSAGFRDSMKGAILLDSARGRWKKDELCRVMAEQAVRLRVQIIFIEDSQGARWLEDDIKRTLQEVGATTTQIIYFTISTEPNAKQTRFEDIHNALKADQLWFSTDIPKAQLDYICHELSHFKYRVQRQKDDLSDSIGHLLKKLQEPIETTRRELPASPAQMILQEKMLRQLVYGTTDSPKDRPELEPAWGYRVEELKSEPLKEFDGALSIRRRVFVPIKIKQSEERKRKCRM
jgi:predicted phage terminase large subunit-like protein